MEDDDLLYSNDNGTSRLWLGFGGSSIFFFFWFLNSLLLLLGAERINEMKEMENIAFIKIELNQLKKQRRKC